MRFSIAMIFILLTYNLGLCNTFKTHYSNKRYSLNDIFTISANMDSSYRTTNFIEEKRNTIISFIDNRFELWFPPFKRTFSWGPYLRLSVISSNHKHVAENAWLAKPGIGFQLYPFSYFTKKNWAIKTLLEQLGPLRLFVEYNKIDYWGKNNQWRPDEQTRFGFDYYREINVNKITKAWWLETFHMLTWSSANEFDSDYDSLLFANSIRMGIRIPGLSLLSIFTPYFILESSLSENSSYHWENKLQGGGGIRLTPDLRFMPKFLCWIKRFVIYTEYIDVFTYYHSSPKSNIPSYDFRCGISISIGDFYK